MYGDGAIDTAQKVQHKDAICIQRHGSTAIHYGVIKW